MANQTLSVADYLSATKPFPVGTTVTILDNKTAVESLTAEQIAEFSVNNVVCIDVIENSVSISYALTQAILNSNISFDDADLVTVTNGKNGGAFTPQQISVLSAKRVDLIAPALIENSVAADVAAAVVNSDIRFRDESPTLLVDTGSNIAGLSVEVMRKLSEKSFDFIDASDDVLLLSYDQYSALYLGDIPPATSGDSGNPLLAGDSALLVLTNSDTVTLKMTSSELSALSSDEVAAFKAKGIDVLVAKDNGIALTVGQYHALGTVKLSASDAVTLSDSGAKLSSLTVAQIAAFAVAGIDGLDATDQAYSLSLAQYEALGALKLSSDDAVTVQADTNAALSGGGNHLTLTGNAVIGTGNSLANVMTGNGKNNLLAGLEGNDVLYGSLGNDQLRGGAGKDIFVFDTKLNKSRNVDKVYDFKSADDSLWLNNKVFTKLGSGSLSKPKKFKADMFVEGKKAQDAEDRIVYDRKMGALYYDQDGTGSKAQVKIATITTKTKLYYHDLFVI